MGSFLDNLVAARVLQMLVTPFEKTDAFKYGIIDKQGNQLKRIKDLKTTEENDSFTALHRLVFSLKKLIAKVPGGSSQLGSLVAAYYLVKENPSKTSVTKEEFEFVLNAIDSGVHFVEEEIEVEKFLSMYEDAPTNAVGSGEAVATDYPAIRKKKKTGFQPSMFRRPIPVEVK